MFQYPYEFGGRNRFFRRDDYWMKWFDSSALTLAKCLKCVSSIPQHYRPRRFLFLAAASSTLAEPKSRSRLVSRCGMMKRYVILFEKYRSLMRSIFLELSNRDDAGEDIKGIGMSLKRRRGKRDSVWKRDGRSDQRPEEMCFFENLV